MHRAFFFSLFFLFFACSPQTYEDFQMEAERIDAKILHDLKEVHTKQDLLARTSHLKKNYKKMAKLIALFDEYLQSHEMPSQQKEPSSTSQQLCHELLRIYEIPGAKEVLQRIQQEALYYLPKQPFLSENTVFLEEKEISP